MYELPASVRLALWTTSCWNGGPAFAQAIARALPDIDHVSGDLARVELWRDLCERALFVALPRSGDMSRMPSTSSHVAALAVDAGECVFVAGIGGVLVPAISEYGPEGDIGVRAHWSAHDAEPVARHRFEMLDLRQVRRTLVARLAEHTDRFERVGGRPWGHDVRATVETGVGRTGWGVPEGVPARALALMAMAADVSRVAERTGRLATLGSNGLDSGTVRARESLLRSVAADADDALVDATNIAVMTIAGWRAPEPD